MTAVDDVWLLHTGAGALLGCRRWDGAGDAGFLRELRANGVVTRVAAIAAIGGFLFGYDTGVISGALLYIKRDFDAGPFEQEAIVSVLLLGAAAGALLSGWLADKIGRKWTKVLSGSVYVIGALGCAFALNAPMLIGCRALLGFSVGTASFVSPMYISEVAPPKVRGGLTSFNQLAVTTGIAVAYLVNYFFKDVSGNWRWMLGIAVIPGAALAIGMLTVPRTPRWLVEQGKDDDARKALEKLRAGTDTDPDHELDEIRRSSQEARGTSVRDLFRPPVRTLLVVGLGLAVFQQIVGVNTVIYYAPTILQQTGLGAGNAITQTLTVGLTNVVFTIVAILLLDKVGRRPLLITGTVVVGVALLGLAAYFGFSGLQDGAPWLALVSLLVFIAGYAVGLGPVFWLMISEIFPQRLRSKSMSMTTVVNWLANLGLAPGSWTRGLCGWGQRSRCRSDGVLVGVRG
ncbi:sugar porter family MFS transporter, partial [Actinoplanes sp. NPDC026619]|uniref:sugar porter family MFS transporter n=1 Tax=Actinoplanes sp. NPDC026619 TaxID=3155798 RepID=UPI0034010139